MNGVTDQKHCKALLQESLSGGSNRVRCLLCPHRCEIDEGSLGRCRVRQNIEGVLHALSYGAVSSLALDPIEKKPFAQFHPGSFILSAGSFGCNLGCKFCQNHEISQHSVPDPDSGLFGMLSPDELVFRALSLKDRGNIGVAYTYNEPFVNYEFMLETAQLVRTADMLNAVVTNGYVSTDALEGILPFIDAVNIDLKAFSDSFYRYVCGGSLAPVQHSIAFIAEHYPRCHMEITTLFIPGLNSSENEIKEIARWLSTFSPEIPLHLTRHHPAWKMTSPEPIEPYELNMLAQTAREFLRNVYVGNV